jgi:hypothetical protein
MLTGVAVGRDFVDWLFETAEWEIRWLDILPTVESGATIVLPTEDDFPVDSTLTGHELALDLFGFVLEHANLSEWPFVLQPARPPEGAVKGDVVEEPALDANSLIVPYDRSDLAVPDFFVACCGRGIAHYYAQDTHVPAPGGREKFDATVDVTAVFLGFGVFMVNACRHVERRGLGFSFEVMRRTLGVLGEAELCYALALRLVSIGEEFATIKPHLRRELRPIVSEAIKDLQKNHGSRIAALHTMKPSQDGPYR